MPWRLSFTLVAIVAAAVVAVAQTPGERNVSWDRARAEIAKWRATLDNSGLVEVEPLP